MGQFKDAFIRRSTEGQDFFLGGASYFLDFSLIEDFCQKAFFFFQ